jgi:hypothetical protein
LAETLPLDNCSEISEMPQFHLIVPSYRLIRTCGQSIFTPIALHPRPPSCAPGYVPFHERDNCAREQHAAQNQEAIAIFSTTAKRLCALSHIHAAFEFI